MVTQIISFLSILTVMLLLRNMVSVFPSLIACVIRTKENMNLEASVKLGRNRDLIAASMIPIFCLIVSKYKLYDISFLNGYLQDARFGLTVAIFAAYVLFRMAVCRLIKPQRIPKKTYTTAANASRTFFISALLQAVIPAIMARTDIVKIKFLITLIIKNNVMRMSISVPTEYLLDISHLREITWLWYRSFVRISKTYTYYRLISLTEIQSGEHLRTILKKRYRSSKTYGTYPQRICRKHDVLYEDSTIDRREGEGSIVSDEQDSTCLTETIPHL